MKNNCYENLTRQKGGEKRVESDSCEWWMTKMSPDNLGGFLPQTYHWQSCWCVVRMMTSSCFASYF